MKEQPQTDRIRIEMELPSGMTPETLEYLIKKFHFQEDRKRALARRGQDLREESKLW